MAISTLETSNKKHPIKSLWDVCKQDVRGLAYTGALAGFTAGMAVVATINHLFLAAAFGTTSCLISTPIAIAAYSRLKSKLSRYAASTNG